MHPRRPHTDDHSLCALHLAIDVLATLRGLVCPITGPTDPADVLHLAWSLSLQIDACLLDLINHAHDHGYSWDHIRDLLTPTTP